MPLLNRYPKSLIRLILLGYGMVLVPLLLAGLHAVYAVTQLQRDGVVAIDSAVGSVRDIERIILSVAASRLPSVYPPSSASAAITSSFDADGGDAGFVPSVLRRAATDLALGGV